MDIGSLRRFSQVKVFVDVLRKGLGLRTHGIKAI